MNINVAPLSGSQLYPPSFTSITRTLVQELLTTDHPHLIIDVDATWLFCRHRSVAPGTQVLPVVYPLIDSIVEYFTGRLNWSDVEALGLYATSLPDPAASPIEGLEHAQVMSLYTHARQKLHVRFTQSINDYWNQDITYGKSRQRLFVEQRSEALKLEAKRRVNEGEMGANFYSMLSTVLTLREDQAQSPVIPHGVFSVTLNAHGKRPMMVTGAFVLTAVYSPHAPASDDQVLGNALLYTSDKGLETFPDLKRLTEALQERLQASEQRKSLLTALTLEDLSELTKAAQDPLEPLQCHYLPLQADFINVLLHRQLDKQTSDFAQALQQARSVQMACSAFEQWVPKVLSSHLHFDDHRFLDRHDQALAQEHLPDWLLTMTADQRSQWLHFARQSGELALDLHKSCVTHFGGDEFNPDTFVDKYINTLLSEALKKQSVRWAPEFIKVSITQTTPQFPGLVPSLNWPDTEVKRYTLKALMHQRHDELNLSGAISIEAADEAGLPIPEVNGGFIRALFEKLQLTQAFERFLKVQLQTSPYAIRLRQTQGQLMMAQLRMALLEAEQRGFPDYARQWVAAVIDAPNPDHRRNVGVDTVEVRFLQIHQTRLPNMLLVVLAGKLNTRPVVLCTFGAPDGIVLRCFDSLSHLKSEFLEREQFKPYIARQIPASKRPDSLGVLEYDKWLKHWRLPDAMRYLTQPLPIPSVVFHPVTFVLQTENFLDDNHAIKIDHLTHEAHLHFAQLTTTEGNLAFGLITNIALLFLPPPVMLPLALGLAFYKAWSGYRKFQADDFEGATQAFLDAVSYVAAGVLATRVQSQAFPHSSEPLALVEGPIRRPHLVRTVGRDGQTQIGYLLSHTSAPRFSTAAVSVKMDAARFVRIELGNETCYVNRRFNLFGHSQLYRTALGEAGSIVHTDEYVVRNSSGIWTLVGGTAPRLSNSLISAAKSTLDDLINDWPHTLEAADETEKAAFTTRYMALSATSNSERFPEILTYSEGESAPINRFLRAGIRNTRTQQFLEQFYQLSEYGGPAYRAAFVSDAGLARYQNQIGAVFADSGVQSASVCRANASRWGQDAFVAQNATSNNHPIVMIFDPSVPKKNMFTHFLGDHVAVAPNTCVQLQAMRYVEDRWYVYFSSPKEITREVYDIYSGAQELMV